MSEYRFAKSFNKRTTKKASVKQVRTSNYGDDWDKISKTCLSLANHVCADCRGRANRAHHIVPLSRGGSNRQINLKAVCETCHSKYHSHLR
jgi:5-methylcytosine-specific restriction endonuclease McrA